MKEACIAALTAAQNDGVNVEERRRQDARAVVDDDLSLLQNDEESRIVRVRDSDWRAESTRDQPQRNVLRQGGARAQKDRRQQSHDARPAISVHVQSLLARSVGRCDARPALLARGRALE